jgi:hypothetical protein
MNAQQFMNDNQLKQCWECDGQFFKHKENAESRSQAKDGAQVTEHGVNAGVKKAKAKPKDDEQPQ